MCRVVYFVSCQLKHAVPLGLVLLATLLAGCRDRSVTAAREPAGRFVLVFTNRSDFLVNVMLLVLPQPPDSITWFVPVAPGGWESLTLDCRVEQVVVLGALVVNELEGAEPTEVSFDDPLLVRGEDFSCGSVIEVAMENTDTSSVRDAISIDVETLNSGRESAAASQVGPGSDSGFVLVEAASPSGVSAELILSWEDAEDRIFRTVLTLTGREPKAGFLLNCPVQRFTLGELNDASAPGGTLGDGGATLEATAPLDGEAISCGSTIELAIVESAAAPAGRALTLQALEEGIDQPNVMFGDIRDLLMNREMLDKPSTLLLLLPSPQLPEDEP